MKKHKSINFIVPLVVYPFDVMVSFCETDAQLKYRVKNYGLNEYDFEIMKYTADTCRARAVRFSNGAHLMRMRYFPHTPDMKGTLSHEIFHIVTFIMEKIGMELIVMKSDEAYAYLIGYLTETVYQKLMDEKLITA